MNNKFIISIFVCVAIASCALMNETIDPERLSEFEQFKAKFNKYYYNEHEHHSSFHNYKTSREHIVKHQMENPNAKFGHTKFSDMSPEEFENKMLNFDFSLFKKAKQQGIKLKAEPMKGYLRQGENVDNSDLPESFDWRDKGIITPAKFQNTCGSCWTFATTGVIESQYALKYGELLHFSEQMLLDCDNINQGCRGGLMTDAYQYLQQTGGIQTADTYGDYKNKKDICNFDKTKVKAKVVDWYQIPENEETIRRELVKNGPVAVGINARTLQFYEGGIVDPKNCDDKINHAVLIVGYGVEEGIPYWLIKNQWGAEWGIKGFFKLIRGKKQCGIHTYASIAYVEKVQ
ncbi:hypothetical protein ABPG74_008053 [Tetrahymena malaccensis]